ncbi:MAG: hypothetical protein HKN28_12090 [Alphaproteobacteria bacterium]|nr:hypothetical protein [Alphaproteobacteria bacterium]
MYSVDGNDEVNEITDVPQSDVGAPLPAVIAAEHHVDLIYLIQEPDPNWDGTYVNVVGSDTKREGIACIRFDSPCAHFFWSSQ